MRQEFQRALVNKSDLTGIKCQLVSNADSQHRAILKAIERDFLACQLIVAGLAESPASEAYRVSRAFIDDFERAGKPKRKPAEDDEVLRLLKGETELRIDGGAEDGTAEEPGKAD